MTITVIVSDEPRVAPSPRWVGLCRQFPQLNWFPDEWVTKPADDVAIVCAKCPFNGDCLKLALDNEDTYGVWGGTTEYQRRQLLNERHRMRCPGCSSDSIVPQGRGEVCISCGLSWIV